MIDALENLPEVSFIDNTTLEDIQEKMVSDYLSKYKELTGKSATLERADPMTLVMYAASVQLYQLYLYVDHEGKMDLLKYTYGDYLDNLAAGMGLSREPAKPAVTTMRFTLSAAQLFAVSIPAGTRVSDGTAYFATDSYAEIPAGSTYVDILATCTEAGAAGNGILPGAVNTLVDPIPYVGTVANTDTTSGGTDIEDDDTLKQRIYLAPSSYSVAGSADAYKYWILTYNSSIADVRVDTDDSANVIITIIMESGELPSASLITSLENFLADRNIRPLTDHVTVQAPTATAYDISVTYYINTSDSSRALKIQSDVSAAVDEFATWQQSRIGRDINPDKLVSMMMAAGAKRVVVTYPARTVIGSTAIAQLANKTVTYGGLEDD